MQECRMYVRWDPEVSQMQVLLIESKKAQDVVVTYHPKKAIKKKKYRNKLKFVHNENRAK